MGASLMHMIEDEAQADGFRPFPTMWWAIERLTAIRYGDRVPATTLGKIVGRGHRRRRARAVHPVSTVSFMDGLQLCHETRRDVVEARLTDGDGEIAQIGQTAARLGLANTEAAGGHRSKPRVNRQAHDLPALQRPARYFASLSRAIIRA